MAAWSTTISVAMRAKVRRIEPDVGTTPSESADQPATAVADAPSPGLDIDPFAVRVNELMAEDWARWNAEARARTKMRL